MPRIVQTLWFEELGLLHEPFLDTPFGKFTVRQMLILLGFGSLAFALFSIVEDVVLKFVAGGSIITVGLALALQRVKTLPPEKSIILMFAPPKPSQPKGRPKERLVAEPLEARRVDVSVEDLEASAPAKVVGMLKDPHTGRPLANRSFTVYVDGKEYVKGSSDQDGFFTVYFLSPSYGRFAVELKPEGYEEASEKVMLNVQPKVRKK